MRSMSDVEKQHLGLFYMGMKACRQSLLHRAQGSGVQEVSQPHPLLAVNGGEAVMTPERDIQLIFQQDTTTAWG